MTYEERKKAIIRAKKWINDVIDYHQDVLDGEEPDDIEKAIFEECEVILDALEKQIPKKPELYDNEYSCTECDGHLFIFTDSYCSGCGQAIDWSKEYD